MHDNTRRGISSEGAVISWRKARNELMYELVKLARANPDILISDEGKDKENFISFVKQEVCFNDMLTSSDFFVLLMFIKHEDFVKSLQEYSAKINKVSPHYLLRKARTASNKALKAILKSHDFAQKWEDFRDKN